MKNLSNEPEKVDAFFFSLPPNPGEETVKIRLLVAVAPTGQAIIVDVNMDGITLFTNQAYKQEK